MNTIAESLLSLLGKEKFRKADLVYTFAGTTAHKLLLSPVLDERFYGPLSTPPAEFPDGVEHIIEEDFGLRHSTSSLRIF